MIPTQWETKEFNVNHKIRELALFLEVKNNQLKNLKVVSITTRNKSIFFTYQFEVDELP